MALPIGFGKINNILITTYMRHNPTVKSKFFTR